jgi:hypothetical protein
VRLAVVWLGLRHPPVAGGHSLSHCFCVSREAA